MTTTDAATQAGKTVDEIFSLYQLYGHQDYGERVTMLMHMVQAALLAEAEGYDDEMVVAAFLHDIGHFFEHGEKMDIYGTMAHDDIGGNYLREKGFPERMAQLVASHVAAKRYLTAVSSAYMNSLSEASKQTLTYQGGPMNGDEIVQFEMDENYSDYVAIRVWDDQGKETNMTVKDEDLRRLKQKTYNYLVSYLSK
jgi:putative nucleotidyltransferase with HDIG domain